MSASNEPYPSTFKLSIYYIVINTMADGQMVAHLSWLSPVAII